MTDLSVTRKAARRHALTRYRAHVLGMVVFGLGSVDWWLVVAILIKAGRA